MKLGISIGGFPLGTEPARIEHLGLAPECAEHPREGPVPDGMDGRHDRGDLVEACFVPWSWRADHRVVHPQVGQVRQVGEDHGRVGIGVDEGGHGLLDRAVVTASVFAVAPEDVELVPDVVGETSAGQVEEVAHVSVARHQPQGLSLAASGDQDRRMRALQRVG